MNRLATILLLLAALPSGAAAQAHLLVVSGVGGEQRYEDEFYEWGAAMVDAARDRFGLPEDRVTYLAEDPERDRFRIAARSTRENVERAIRDLAARAGPDDRVMILLIGHGSSDARGARFLLPGRNLEAGELAELLGAFASQPLAVVNTAPASGGFQEVLEGENRVIVTATRTSGERQETLFGGFFVAAFTDEGADTDHDGRVTLAEAFEYARREVERAYTGENRLQMEHARMEGDLQLAGAFSLGTPGRPPPGELTPAARALHAERQRLEEEIETLRLRRDQMSTTVYERELENLLLELARTNQRIRALDGEGER